jgi:tetratricopeptide (TPR) repeat protein
MPKSSAEQVAEFLLEFLPSLLPKPADSAARAVVGTFGEQLNSLLKQPRLKRELLEAAQGAETDFRAKAKEQLGNDELTQAVASFPLFDRELFQAALQSLPSNLNEEILADRLKSYIADDWKGKFTPAELRQGAAIYLNCLRVRLLRVEGYADLVTRLAALRTDERTEQMLAMVKELLQLVNALLEKMTVPPGAVTTLFTIPPPVADFTGREKELAELKAAFARGAVITGVSGGGGIGKTELARRLAQELAGDFPAARLSMDLLGTSERPLTPDEAMRRLLEPFYPNQKLPDEPEQLAGLYRQTFATRKSLLLLDNAADAAQVRPLIPPPPSAAIVTSRQHFTLSEFGLTPLRLDVLSPEEARQFLRATSPKLRDAPDAEVEQLADLCGRLPLALRVAASLLNDRDDWTPATLRKRLADERTRLARLKREGDLDVDAAISLSYALLDDDLKIRFGQLGVFTAPFLRLSAQAVWGIADEAEADDLLGKLTTRSLLNVSPSPFAAETEGEAVYALHDLTRLFAYARLLEHREQAEEAVMRHAHHALEWASEADTLYQKGNENILRGLTRFRFIWPHLLAAYERLLPEQPSRPRPAEADRWLSDFPNRCAYVLDLHLPPRQRIPLLQAALEAARRLGDKSAEGIHLGNLGLAHFALGDARKAIEFYEQALALDREIGDRRGEGAALGNLGNAYFALGDARKAIEFYQQALAIAQEIGDRRNEGTWLGNLGLAYAALGDARKAIEFYEKCLELHREIGDRRGEGNALGNLGLAYAALGDARKAIEFYQQALAIAREIGDRRGEGADLGNLGSAYYALGDARKAIEFYEQALVIDREIGDRGGEGAALGNLGNAYADLGDARKAIEFYEQALAIDREIGDRRGEGNALGNLGLAYAALGDTRKAIEFYEKQLAIAREIGDRRGEGNALANMGMAYKKLGDKEKAKALWQAALAIYRAIESPYAKMVEKWLAGL